MSLIDSPTTNDKRFFEALVTAVDNIRLTCMIRTTYGQSMNGVQWVRGIIEPTFGAKVLVTTVTGYPIILGVLSRTGDDTEFAVDIDTGELEADTGNYSALGRGLVNDPQKPGDLIAGDKVLTNEAGGVLGLLRGGSIVARASKLAQIFVTRYDDLVRIISRNYERFHDIAVIVIASVRGRAYRYNGYADTVSNARVDLYKYQESYGDTVLAEALKGNYYGFDSSSFAGLPAAGDVIRKQWIVNASNQVLMKDELHLTGELFTQVQSAAGTAFTYVDRTSATFDVKTLDGTFTQITTTPTSVIITYNGSNIVTINSSKIECKVGSNTIVIDSSKIEGTFGTNKVTVDNTKAQLSANGGAHFVTADTAGVHLG